MGERISLLHGLWYPPSCQVADLVTILHSSGCGMFPEAYRAFWPLIEQGVKGGFGGHLITATGRGICRDICAVPSAQETRLQPLMAETTGLYISSSRPIVVDMERGWPGSPARRAGQTGKSDERVVIPKPLVHWSPPVPT